MGVIHVIGNRSFMGVALAVIVDLVEWGEWDEMKAESNNAVGVRVCLKKAGMKEEVRGDYGKED